MVPVTFPLQNRYRYPWENDIKSTVAGIYALRQLQFKRSGRLDLKAVLALDCCSIVIGSDSDHPTVIARRTIVRRGNLIPDPQIATASMKPRNDTG